MNRIAIIRDAAGLIGAAMVAWGIGMMHLPSGIIAAGVLLVAGAYLSARSS